MHYDNKQLIENTIIDERTPVDFIEPRATGYSRSEIGLLTVGVFASQYPNKWRTIYYHLTFPNLTTYQLAKELRISERTVERHLHAFKNLKKFKNETINEINRKRNKRSKK